MVSPVNLDFATADAAPGTALGWVTNINNNGVLIADYRGSIAYPLNYEAFDHSWGSDHTFAAPFISGATYAVGALITHDAGRVYLCMLGGTDAASGGPTGTGVAITSGGLLWRYVGPEFGSPTQDWTSTIAVPEAALFDKPGRPSGTTFEGFGYGWSNFPAMSSGAVSPGWPAPATGPCNVYLTIIDTALAADYAGLFSYEDFSVGWSSPTSIASSGVGHPVDVALSTTNHGIAVGQTFHALISRHLINTVINGFWASLTATSATHVSVPVTGIGVGGATGALWFESAFESNLVPPPWAANVSYALGAFIASNGNWYQAANAGTSAVAGAGPLGAADFVDNRGPHQILWAWLRAAPRLPLYAEQAAVYDAHAHEDFAQGWHNVPYYVAMPASSEASYNGWVPCASPPPAIIAGSNLWEDFYQTLPTPVPVALIDVGANLISLAPKQHIPDAARVTFITPNTPAATGGGYYPSPIVPKFGYILWNAAPAIGMDRVRVGDPTAATFVAIQSSLDLAVVTFAPHGLVAGDVVFISGHLANTSLNGFRVVDSAPAPTATTFSVVGTPGGGAGLATGTAYGPIIPITLTSAGGAPIALALDPEWSWPAPG